MDSKIAGLGPVSQGRPLLYELLLGHSISVFQRTSLTSTCACLYTTAVYAVQTTVNFHKERGSFHVQIGNNKKSCTGFQGETKASREETEHFYLLCHH